jgi:O-antigen ligase
MSALLPLKEFRGEFPWIKSVKQFIQFSIMAFIYYGLLLRIDNRKLFVKCIKVFIISAFVVSLFGLYQFVDSVFALNLPFTTFGVGNISFGSQNIGSYQGFPRISSTFSEAPLLGQFLISVLPLLIVAKINHINLLPISSLWNNVIALVIFAAFICTFSRAPYAGFAASLAVIILLQQRFTKIVALAIKVLMVLALFVILESVVMGFPSVFGVIASIKGRDVSSLERLTTLITAFNILKTYPVLGVGIGNFGFHYNAFKPSWGFSIMDKFGYYPASQGILSRIISETGLLGLLAFALIFWAILKSGMNTIRSIPDENPFWNTCATALLASFIGCTISFLSVDTFLSNSYYYFIIAMIVLAEKFVCESSKKTELMLPKSKERLGRISRF